MADQALLSKLPSILAAHLKWRRGEDGGSRANLRGAYLRGAYLRGANGLAEAKGLDPLPFGPVTLPDGSFRAYKLARGSSGERVIVTLEIPEDAERVAPLVGRKCRASKARVIALSEGESATSWHDPAGQDEAASRFTYRVGETVTAHRWDPSPFVECSAGIHFLISRREAEAYLMTPRAAGEEGR